MDLGALLKERVSRNNLILFSERRAKFREHPFGAAWQALRRRISQFFDVRIPNLLGASEFAASKTFFSAPIKVLRRDKFCMDTWGVIGGGTDILTTKFFIDTIRKGVTVIDGGAYIGWYTLLAAELTGSTGSVHAFEPTARTLPVLRRNIAGRKNIFLNNAALYKQSGQIEFYDFGKGLGYANAVVSEAKPLPGKRGENHGQHLLVQGVSLDNYCAKVGITPDFIKLDLEGGEYDALLGAQAVLKSKQPIVVIEVSQTEIQSGEYNRIADFLRVHGYEAYRMFADKDFNAQLQPFKPAQANNFAMENIIFSARMSGLPWRIVS